MDLNTDFSYMTDEAVRTVIANGLEKEAHGKVIDEKWKKWDEKT